MDILDLEERHDPGPQTHGDRKAHHEYPCIASRGLKMIGLETAESGNHFVRHSPDFAQIIITYGGEGAVNVGGKWKTCKTGMAYLTPAHVPHAYRTESDQKWEFCFFVIQPGQTERFLVPFKEPTLIEVNQTPSLNAVRGFLDEANHHAGAPTLELWMNVVLDCLRRVAHSSRTRIDYRLARAWSLVSQSLESDWTLEKIARIADMSKEQFRRLCHETYNHSPIKRLTILRMRHAADRLILTKEPLNDIAEKSGYTDPLAFRKAFCRIIGISPSKYRKQSRDFSLAPMPSASENASAAPKIAAQR